ncbi:hypothetical protein [Burkholderia ubonensis]|uniref:hypothetical protein n=1 Tax=Burkholderia ubonensis TaxID=101571 RepID=UPI000B0C993F|nr:hypothetical protein [Burkholderia ubonensis]
MPRLTEAQKEANKAASRERVQAFKARRKAYEAEVEAANTAADRLPEQVELEAARAAFDAAADERSQALAAIDAEIARLQAQRADVDARCRAVLEGVRLRKDAAWTARAQAGKKLLAEVNARYPDMVNCFYSSQWQRPEGV